MSGVYPKATVVYKGPGNVTLQILNDELFAVHIPALIFVVVCMAAGLVGNLIVIIIYKTKFRSSNHRYFILFLAVVDLLASCTAMPFVMASLRLPYLTTSDIICKTNRCVLYYLNNAAGLLIVVISIERFQKICRPFKKQFTHRQTLYLCWGVITFSALMAVPSTILYSSNPIDTGVGNITGYQCSISDNSAPYFRVYLVLLMLEAMTSICVFVVLYSFIIRTLWKNDQFLSSMRRKQASKSSRRTTHLPTDHIDDVDVPSEMDVDNSEQMAEESNSASANDSATFSSSVATNGTEENIATECFVFKDAGRLCKLSDGIMTEEKTASDDCKKRHTTDAGNVTRIDKTNCHTKRAVSDPRLNRIHVTFTAPSPAAGERLACTTLPDKKGQEEKGVKTKLRRPGKHSRATARVTVMMLTVSVFFAIAYIPHLVMIFISSMNMEFLNSLSKIELTVFQIFLRSFFINNVVNPIIYLVFDTKFRKLTIEVMKGKCRFNSSITS